MSSKERVISLTSLAGGAAVERFNDELQHVLENILDPNTEAQTERVIDLKVKFKPNEDRSTVGISIECSSKIGSSKSIKSFGYIGSENGKPVATEFNPKQGALEFVESGKEKKA